MKIFIDECIYANVYQQLKTVFFKHQFFHPSEHHSYAGVKDIELFERLAADEFDLIVTTDLNQMYRKEEVEALLGGNIHWVGIRHPAPGFTGAAQMSAAITSAIAHLIEQDTSACLKLNARLPNLQPTKIMPILDHYHKTRYWKAPQRYPNRKGQESQE